MTGSDKRVAILMAVTLLAPAVHAQVAPGTTTAARAAARAVAARTTTSAARTATALNSLAAGSSASASNTTSVMGYIWTGDGTPLSNATMQLRNIVTGQIEQVSTTLQNGAFAFQNVSTGTYAIEFVTEVAGRVLAVGQAFSVAPGETVATFVRLGGRLALLLPDLAGNAAQAVVSNVANAVATGVVSIAGTVAPAQPASPLR
ncbi:MAG TPA: hypothetical protein VMN81_10105 [Vicinamibacterales bacterium]|nr:hypothetical protein [Vicinamibacterales bacterium]